MLLGDPIVAESAMMKVGMIHYLGTCVQHHTIFLPEINNNLNEKGGDTAGLSLLYTVTGQLKKLKKLARLLSIKGEASQEYRSGCWIT